MKIVPEMKDITYGERLKEMRLPGLKRQKGESRSNNLYMIVNGNEKLDKQDLVVKEETREMREHSKRIKKELMF